jgi:hypothetical protein
MLPMFPITSDYAFTSLSLPTISSLTPLLNPTLDASINLLPVLSVITTNYASVWNEDHYENHLLPGTHYDLNFIWTCKHSSSTITLTYSLSGIRGIGPAPSWVVLDTMTSMLTLDPTPLVTSPTTYSFSLKFEWSGEVAYKNFYLTVSP